jgi:hypothetical protein
MIIRLGYAKENLPNTGLLVGLSCRFTIANPQQVPVLLHKYDTDPYQGVRNAYLGIQHLELSLKTPFAWESTVWATIPLGYSTALISGYIDLMKYLGVRAVNLADVTVGLQGVDLHGGDSVVVLATILTAAESASIPDDFLPY